MIILKKQQLIDQFQLIREWADNRGLYSKGDAKTQYIKLQEEAGELAQAILKRRSARSCRCYR